MRHVQHHKLTACFDMIWILMLFYSFQEAPHMSHQGCLTIQFLHIFATEHAKNLSWMMEVSCRLGRQALHRGIFLGDAESDTGSDMCRAQRERVSLSTQVRDTESFNFKFIAGENPGWYGLRHKSCDGIRYNHWDFSWPYYLHYKVIKVHQVFLSCPKTQQHEALIVPLLLGCSSLIWFFSQYKLCSAPVSLNLCNGLSPIPTGNCWKVLGWFFSKPKPNQDIKSFDLDLISRRFGLAELEMEWFGHLGRWCKNKTNV